MQILKDTDTLDPTLRLRNVKLDLTARTTSAEMEILPTPPFPGAAGTKTLVDLMLPPNSVVVMPPRPIELEEAITRIAGRSLR